MLILCSSFVFADKIIDIQQQGELVVAYPPNTHFEEGIPFNLTFMVHNSTGSLISDATCVFNLVDEGNNIVIYNTTLNVDPIGIQYLLMNETIVDNNGNFNYHVYCNNSEEGFLVSGFHMTKTGLDEDTMYNLTISYIIGLSALFLILLYIVFNLDNKHIVLKFFIVSFVIYLGVSIPRVLYLLEPADIISDLIKYYLRLIYVFTVYVFLAFLWMVGEYYGKTSGIKDWFNNKIGRKGYD